MTAIRSFFHHIPAAATWLLTAALLLAGTGCGYHIGSIAHPQIRSIAIAPVVNDTLSPFVAADMRGMLCELFMVDGSYKVKEMSEADCILYCRILEVSFTENAQYGYDSEKNYQPSEWRVTVKAEFTVIIPTRKNPLIPKRVVSGSTIFQVFGDPSAMKRRGILMACRDAGNMIVEYSTEAW